MRLATFGAAIAAASLCATSASAGLVVDVDNLLLAPPGTWGNSGAGAFSDLDNVVGQTWTVGTAGKLQTLEVVSDVYASDGSPFDVTLSVFRGYGGSLLGADVLASVSRSSSLIVKGGVSSFDFSSFDVAAQLGEILTWEMSVADCDAPCLHAWTMPFKYFPSGQATPDYAGGIPFTASPNFGFSPSAGKANFRITMAVPEPGAWALMILGFGGVGAALRGRAGRRPVTA